MTDTTPRITALGENVEAMLLSAELVIQAWLSSTSRASAGIAHEGNAR
jgi:hypothetical protein